MKANTKKLAVQTQLQGKTMSYYLGILLLLFVLPRCLDMWTSIPAHIYPHLSKARLSLKINGGINEQYLQWVSYMPGTTVHDVSLLVFGTGCKA